MGNWEQFLSQGAVGAEARMGSPESRAGLLEVNPLRITAHRDITCGPGNLQLETAVGQGSIQWEQHPKLSLSLHPSGYLLLAQGAGLAEPLVCPSTGATVRPALAPAPYACTARCIRSLLSQSTDPGTAIHPLFFLFTAVTVGILVRHVVQMPDPPA